jgi:hypothetical protein
MALTFSRWIIAIVIACAAIAALLTKESKNNRDRMVVDSTLYALESKMNQAQRRASTLASQVRLLRVRDSVQTTLAGMPNPSRLVISPEFPAPVVAAVNAQLDARAAVIGNVAKVPTVTVVVLDTGRFIDGIPRQGFGGLFNVDFVLPDAAGKSCLTLVRVDARPINMNLPTSLSSEYASDRLFGPCAFYQAFGAPGPGIALWLASRGWGLGQVGDWSKPVSRWTRQNFSGLALLGVPVTTLALRDETSPNGARCAAGETSACTMAVLNQGANVAPPLWGSVVPVRIRAQLYNSPEFLGTPRALGPHEITFLSDLVHDIGPEKFARFWQSSLPPVDAFREATGRDLGEWTREWADKAYGVEHGRGPSTNIASIGFAIATLVLGGGLAVRAMSRRQHHTGNSAPYSFRTTLGPKPATFASG